jgi:hypothetical protein
METPKDGLHNVPRRVVYSLVGAQENTVTPIAPDCAAGGTTVANGSSLRRTPCRHNADSFRARRSLS